MPKFEAVNTNSEEAELAESFLRECREKGMQPIEGELEKTEEDTTMLEEVNTILVSVADRFNLERENIDSHSVHILSAEAFMKQSPYKTGGMYKPKFESIILNDDALKNKSSRIKTLLHESLHAISHRRFFLQEDGTLEPYRVGYSNEPLRGGYNWFEGLNEAVITLLENTLMRAHASELQNKFGIAKGDITQAIKEHEYFERFLYRILNKVAEYRNENYVAVADRFVKGHFTGEMLHLKDIEKVYGPKSLRILAMLDDGHDSRPEQVALRNMVLKYFSVEDASQREEMTKDVFTQFEVVLQSKEAKKDTPS